MPTNQQPEYPATVEAPGSCTAPRPSLFLIKGGQGEVGNVRVFVSGFIVIFLSVLGTRITRVLITRDFLIFTSIQVPAFWLRASISGRQHHRGSPDEGWRLVSGNFSLA